MYQVLQMTSKIYSNCGIVLPASAILVFDGRLRLLGFILVLFLRFVFRILTKVWNAVNDFTHKTIQQCSERQNELMYFSILKRVENETYCQHIPNSVFNSVDNKSVTMIITDLHNTLTSKPTPVMRVMGPLG